MTPDTISSIVNYMKGQGSGARGNVCFTWTGTGGKSGHSVFYEVLKSGQVIFRDCQTNRVFTPETLLSKASYAEVTRLDNVPFNIDAIKTVIDAL